MTVHFLLLVPREKEVEQADGSFLHINSIVVFEFGSPHIGGVTNQLVNIFWVSG